MIDDYDIRLYQKLFRNSSHHLWTDSVTEIQKVIRYASYLSRFE